MAGKRLYENSNIEPGNSQRSFRKGERFVLTNDNPHEDRNLEVVSLLKALRDGTGLEGGFTFTTTERLNEVLTPSGGKYKIENGEIKYWNSDDSQWYTIAVSTSGGDTLKWKDDRFAVSVDNSGKVQYPTNFIKANSIVTADGGQLKSIKAGTGLVGTAYNGAKEQTWTLDSSFVESMINSKVTTAKEELTETINNNVYELTNTISNNAEIAKADINTTKAELLDEVQSTRYISTDTGERVKIRARTEIVDNKRVPTLIPVICYDAFSFDCAKLEASKKWRNSAFSFAMTFVMDKEDLVKNLQPLASDYQWVGTCVYNKSNESNSGFFIALQGTATSSKILFNVNAKTAYSVSIEHFEKYCDGKPHHLVASFDTHLMSLIIDGDFSNITIKDFPGFWEVENRLPLTIFKNYSKIARIKYFNFYMYLSQGEYSFFDYARGEDEPEDMRLLPVNWEALRQNKDNPHVLEPNTITVKGESISVSDINSNVLIYPFGESPELEVGQTYKFSVRKTGKAIGFKLYSGTLITDENSCDVSWKCLNITKGTYTTGYSANKNMWDLSIAGTDWEDELECEITFSPLIDNLKPHFTILGQEGGCEANCTVTAHRDNVLLSLQDSMLNKEVYDISGNNNYATVSDDVSVVEIEENYEQ